MADISIQIVKNGISQKLDELFPGITIYDDRVPQSLTRPSFILSKIKVSQDQIINNRYQRKMMFQVIYIPDDSDVSEQITEVDEVLMNELEYIMVSGGLLRGTKLESEKQSDSLIFKMNVDVMVLKPKQMEVWMEKLQINHKIRKG